MAIVPKRLKLTLRTGTLQLEGELQGHVANEQTWVNLQKGLHGVMGFTVEEVPPLEPRDVTTEYYEPSTFEIQLDELRARVQALELLHPDVTAAGSDVVTEPDRNGDAASC
jgi:hypothetical protein